MDSKYEYVDEASINPELICSICQSPFIHPCCNTCGDIFCYKCITDWIQIPNNSCPLCRGTMSIETLSPVPRVLHNMLDQLPVKCKTCEQTSIQRANFDEHARKPCQKTAVSCSRKMIPCPSVDIGCQWTGSQDQLNQHIKQCPFEISKRVIIVLMMRIKDLDKLVDQHMSQILA